MATIMDKTYDPKTGHGCLECTKRPDGMIDLTIHHNNNDLSLYALSARELAEIASRLSAIAYTVINAEKAHQQELREAVRHGPGSS